MLLLLLCICRQMCREGGRETLICISLCFPTIHSTRSCCFGRVFIQTSVGNSSLNTDGNENESGFSFFFVFLIHENF